MTTFVSGFALRSQVRSTGSVELSFVREDIPHPGEGEIVIEVEASPINPSDINVLFSLADFAALTSTGEGFDRIVSAPLSEERIAALKGRHDVPMPVGNEGAGLVIAAGPGAEHLLGKRVAAFAGGFYAQYRLVAAQNVLVLPDGVPAKAGAAAFVNPLTALGMVETLRREGHGGLIHTAAASNLGQMLVRIAVADGIPLINIVRNADQAALLRGLGAQHILDSTTPGFAEDLADAIEATNATLAFDAIGGGTLATTILHAMEVALSRSATAYSTYGSYQLKQVYIYGHLDFRPTVLHRNFGMTWGVGGWLLMPFLQKIGAEATARLHRRVADELTTTFGSHYSDEITLADVLQPESIAAYSQRATGKKMLVIPIRLEFPSPAGKRTKIPKVPIDESKNCDQSAAKTRRFGSSRFPNLRIPATFSDLWN